MLTMLLPCARVTSFTFALSGGAQLAGVAKHVVERYFGVQGEPAFASVRARDDSVPLVDLGNDRTLELIRCGHFHRHDRL